MSVKTHKHLVKGRNGNIKLVLTEDVLHLGQRGEQVEVKPGYARNYLLPRGLGAAPTAHNLRLLEQYRQRLLQALEAKKTDLRSLADQINRLSGIAIEAKATPEGHLYGSVGSVEVVAGLRAKGMIIDEAMVKLEVPIKETGLFAVKINLGYEIETEVKVAVVPVMERR
ncbi:MAG: 50S ribosomal protein L9 [Gemmataceae bacterium]